jgi:hypothetical protein
VRAFFYCVLAVGTMTEVGCQQSVTPPALRGLSHSGRVSLVCREFNTGEGRDIHACPDSDDAITTDTEDRRTVALVTQKLRGEVAAIDLHDQEVIDDDPWQPGPEFLPIGASPTAIVSTPGGVASFVGVAEPGREAIYALPTTCITAPSAEKHEHTRDLTLWAACRLPSRPGELAILADSTLVADAATATTAFRTTCPSIANGSSGNPEMSDWRAAAETPSVGGTRRNDECKADLEDEENLSPAGRRKLLVTLPDDGLIAIYDAQAILNQPPGAFGRCVPDSVLPLSGIQPQKITVGSAPELTAGPHVQLLPDDLRGTATPSYDLDQSRIGQPQSGGIAVSDGKVYVSDLGFPVIHVLDVKDPCAPTEVEPLQPLAFDEPSRPVFTRDVAVSARTLAGEAKNERFLYAVDDADGTSIVFDLSDGASRAPLLRPHVPELPNEPIDRITFNSPINKVLLVSHDVAAVDATTDTATIGVQCSPYPDAIGPEKAFRTNYDSTDYTTGAGPGKLRGIFGVAALRAGQIAVVDVEDWDAPCRRPKSNNPATSGTDWLGCTHDSKLASNWFNINGVYDANITTDNTVDDEASCNVIEPHRARSGRFFRTDGTLGTLAPSLVTAPRLSSLLNGELTTGKADVGRKHPQMLAVAYADSVADINRAAPNGAFLNIGTTRYEQYNYTGVLSPIEIDPATAENNSLILPMVEPRVYASQETFKVTYEGTLIAERASGQLPNLKPGDAEIRSGFEVTDQAGNVTGFLLHDPDAAFCSSGVQDRAVADEIGRGMLGLAATVSEDISPALKAFAATHADFVVLTEDFDKESPYFAASAEQQTLRDSCEDFFGTRDDKKSTRDFLVYAAGGSELSLRPRGVDDVDTQKRIVAMVHDCFPSVHHYEVRAGKQWVVKGGSFLSHMRESNGRCVTDTDVRRIKLRGRAFEISSSAEICQQEEEGKQNSASCGIGPVDPTALDEVCVTSKAHGDQKMDAQLYPDLAPLAIRPSDFGTSLPRDCLFESLKGRFAIYRGQQPSARDMAFTWTVTGGFAAMEATIVSTSVGANVTPEDMVYSESLEALLIVDSASGGLDLVGLGSFNLIGQPYL